MTNNTNEINKLITQRLQGIKNNIASMPGLIQTAVTEDARLINFRQDNLVKLSIGIITDPQGSNFIPTLRFGAGDGSNSNMGYLTKDTIGLNLFYVGNYANNEITGLSIQNGKIYTTCPIEISDTLGNKLLLSVANINSKITEADMTSTLRNTSKGLGIVQENLSATLQGKINASYSVIDPNDLKILADKIKDASITTSAIANLAIDNTKLANLAVDAAKLANSSVTSTKIANAAVGSAAIATAAIGSAHIANGVITNAHILDATIESAKIKSLTADKIVAGTLTGFTIQTASTGKRLILQSNGLASYDGSTLQGWQIDPMGSIGYFRGYTNGVEYGNISASSSSLYLLAKNNANLSLEAQGTGQITFTGPVNFTQATVTGQFTVCWG